MKKVIVISLLAFLFLGSKVKAQGNLQFNQIVFYDMANAGVQAITIPAGKVWKIEALGNGGCSTTFLYLRNSANQGIASFGNPATASNSGMPYWLPSGFVGNFQNLSGCRSSISIIEFNVVP